MDCHDRPFFDKLLWCLVSSPMFVHCQQLIARKTSKLFSSNRAVSQFYEACGIDDVTSRGSVVCLFAANFGGAVFTATALFVCAKTDDPGSRWGDTVQIVAWWRHPVAFHVAHNVLHWEMCSVLHRQIDKATEMASKYLTTVLCLIKYKTELHYC